MEDTQSRRGKGKYNATREMIRARGPQATVNTDSLGFGVLHSIEHSGARYDRGYVTGDGARAPEGSSFVHIHIHTTKVSSVSSSDNLGC